MGAIHGLLYAMGNDKHADSQRQASIALEVSLIFDYLPSNTFTWISCMDCLLISQGLIPKPIDWVNYIFHIKKLPEKFLSIKILNTNIL